MSKEHAISSSSTTQEGNLAIQQKKNEAVIHLLKKWLADESGYDERAWPIVKKAIEENRPSYRRRLGD